MLRVLRSLSSATVLKGSLGLLGLIAIVWALQKNVQSPGVFRAQSTSSSYSWVTVFPPFVSTNAHSPDTNCIEQCAALGKNCASGRDTLRCEDARPGVINTTEHIFGGGLQYQNIGVAYERIMNEYTCLTNWEEPDYTTWKVDCCCGGTYSSSSACSVNNSAYSCPSGYQCMVSRDNDCGCNRAAFSGGGGAGSIETSGTCGEGDCTGECQRWVNASPPPSDPTDPGRCKTGEFCMGEGSMIACCEGYRMIAVGGECVARVGEDWNPRFEQGSQYTCQSIFSCAGSTCGNRTCEPAEIDGVELFAPGSKYIVACPGDCAYQAYANPPPAAPTCGNGRCEAAEAVTATGALGYFGGGSDPLNYPPAFYCPQDCVATLAAAQSHLCLIFSSSASSCHARDPNALCPVPNLHCPFGYATIERECEFDSRGCPWAPVCAPPPSSSSSRSSSSSSSSVSNAPSPSSSSSFSSGSSSISSSSSSSLSSTSTGTPIDTVSSSSVSSVIVQSSSSVIFSSTPSSFSSISSSFPPVQSSSSTAQYSSTFVAGEPACGNGILESGEACDTGHFCTDGAFCTSLCTCQSLVFPSSDADTSIVRCGDGILGEGEQCDLSIPCPNNGFCTASCTCKELKVMIPLCGNGVLNTREECDDGNDQDGDGCDNRCRKEVVAQAQQTSSSVPREPVCGNGILEDIEQCETTSPCQNPTFTCSRCTCIAPVCGDGTRTLGEECDDGNTADGDDCSSICQRAIPTIVVAQQICGNRLAEQGEECDDGNTMNGDGCSVTCSVEHLPDVPQGFADLSLIAERPPEVSISSSAPSPIPVRTGPTPKKTPALPSSTGVRPQMRPAAVFSAPATVPPASFPVAATVTQQTTQYPAYWQPYGSLPITSPSGPVGNTGPASLVLMVSGAAAGMAWMRRKKSP